MIKSSDIIKLLKDKNADLSKEEIERTIEEELAKDESEIDTDLIEYCLDALKEKENISKTKQKKFYIFKITTFVAVTAVLIFTIAAVIPKLTDTKNLTSVTTKENVAESTANVTEKETTTKSYISDDTLTETNPAPIYKEETTKAPSTNKSFSSVFAEESLECILKKQCKANGFDNIILPKNIFESTKILSKTFEEKEAEIKIKSKEKIYNVIIEKSSEEPEEKNVIDVKGVKVSVESENNSSEIRYRKNNLNYKIVFESDYEEAVRIAKTIC